MNDGSAYSVVIVSHNHASTLAACLGSVDRLTPPPARVVVVDNASQDASLATVKEHATDLELETVKCSVNTGFAAAVNTGIRLTSSPWILLLNPDCAPNPDFVHQLLATVDAQPERDRIGAATGKLVRTESDDLQPTRTLDSAGMIVTPSGRHFDRGAGDPDRGQFDHPVWVFGGTGAATLFRRAALDDVAYPDDEIMAESFFAYREDAELAWRLQWRGWRCLYVDTAVAAHRRGFRPEAGRGGHPQVNRFSVRNRFLLRLHCADAGWHLSCLPWWLLRDVVVVVACLTVETSSFAGLVDAWRLRDDAAERRRWVLSRRSESSQRVRRWFRKRGWVEEVNGR
jgi:GT2 family glycosyltransferase